MLLLYFWSVLIELRASSIHGLGAFAITLIRAGTLVVEYVGERIEKCESLRRCQEDNPFIFYLDSQFDLDGSVEWNLAKWVNHSCVPNCEADRLGDQIWITAKRDIVVGEEVTFNYGYDLDSFREHPCSCGASGCVGYILAEVFHDRIPKSVE